MFESNTFEFFLAQSFVQKYKFLNLAPKMILHELIPFFWLPSKDKTKNEFLITSGCLLFRKVWWAVRIGSFFSKIEVFYRPEWTKDGII